MSEVHVMVDLETMGTGPNAAIIAVGAVKFDIPTATIGDSFYRVVDLASSVKEGGVIDASTVLWWMRQSEDARSAFDRAGSQIIDVLLDFSEWVEESEDAKVWGNGATFDNVILASAYDRLGLCRPWQYYNDRCYRTVKALHPDVKMNRSGTHHNAVDDAASQAQHLIDIFREMRGEH